MTKDNLFSLVPPLPHPHQKHLFFIYVKCRIITVSKQKNITPPYMEPTINEVEGIKYNVTLATKEGMNQVLHK
jgi:hypothetical protein